LKQQQQQQQQQQQEQHPNDNKSVSRRPHNNNTNTAFICYVPWHILAPRMALHLYNTRVLIIIWIFYWSLTAEESLQTAKGNHSTQSELSLDSTILFCNFLR